jgi:hypothetical protein
MSDHMSLLSRSPGIPSDIPTELWIEVALELDASDVAALSQVHSLSDAATCTRDRLFPHFARLASPSIAFYLADTPG